MGLKGTMNALFLKDLAAKTHRGLRGWVEAGKSGGGLCYGYDVVKAVDAAGEPIRGERRINEAQAEIVGRIFREFASGTSPRAIARRLNEDGILAPSGGTHVDIDRRLSPLGVESPGLDHALPSSPLANDRLALPAAVKLPIGQENKLTGPAGNLASARAETSAASRKCLHAATPGVLTGEARDALFAIGGRFIVCGPLGATWRALREPHLKVPPDVPFLALQRFSLGPAVEAGRHARPRRPAEKQRASSARGRCHGRRQRPVRGTRHGPASGFSAVCTVMVTGGGATLCNKLSPLEPLAKL